MNPPREYWPGERIARELLWLGHGDESHCRYGDDGELQCTSIPDGYCDFARDDFEKIREHIEARGRRLLMEYAAKSSTATKTTGEEWREARLAESEAARVGVIQTAEARIAQLELRLDTARKGFDQLLAQKVKAEQERDEAVTKVVELPLRVFRLQTSLREAEAARVKAEQERDEARSKTLAWITARAASEARVCEVEQERDEALAARDQALHSLGNCQDRRRAIEARLREVEQERDDADRASAMFQRSKLEAEARLRDLVEALLCIEEWRLPPVLGRDGKPSSYEAEYGSNGAREFIRETARVAIRDAQPASPKPRGRDLPGGAGEQLSSGYETENPRADHEFKPVIGSLTNYCAICSRLWSKHGGRDGE